MPSEYVSDFGKTTKVPQMFSSWKSTKQPIQLKNLFGCTVQDQRNNLGPFNMIKLCSNEKISPRNPCYNSPVL